jgi:hypothetical protein
MFESIVAKITNVVRSTVRAVAAITRKTPMLAPIAIVALFLIW